VFSKAEAIFGKSFKYFVCEIFLSSKTFGATVSLKKKKYRFRSGLAAHLQHTGIPYLNTLSFFWLPGGVVVSAVVSQQQGWYKWYKA